MMLTTEFSQGQMRASTNGTMGAMQFLVHIWSTSHIKNKDSNLYMYTQHLFSHKGSQFFSNCIRAHLHWGVAGVSSKVLLVLALLYRCWRFGTTIWMVADLKAPALRQSASEAAPIHSKGQGQFANRAYTTPILPQRCCLKDAVKALGLWNWGGSRGSFHALYSRYF